MIVRIPGNKNIIVDAKAPLLSYLDSLDTQDDIRRAEFLETHARQIRTHIKALSQRAYWEQFPSTPEFVVLFLPGEAFFSAALEKDPSLIEVGVQEKVILATPTTLIALLRAVAFGWQHQALADNALEISKLGKELYKRLQSMTEYVQSMGRNLTRTVESYNQMVGNLEHRVLVSARKFEALEGSQDASSEKTLQLSAVEVLPRFMVSASSEENVES
jgi:DNA recombination protein RmuC